MTWKKTQNTLLAVFIIIIALLGTHITIEHFAEGKPRCYVCNEVLWHKSNQWQSYDIWACKLHYESAKYKAKHNLDISQNEMNPDVPGEIYRVLKSRRPDLEKYLNESR